MLRNQLLRIASAGWLLSQLSRSAEQAAWQMALRKKNVSTLRIGTSHVAKAKAARGHGEMLPGIDRLLKKAEAQALIDTPHGRRLLSCNNPACCPHGFEDTLKDPRGHYLRQRALQCRALPAVPDPLRADHFLNKVLAETDRKARQIAKLRVADKKVEVMLNKNTVRLDRMRAVLEDLQKTGGLTTRSLPFPSTHVVDLQTKTKDGT